MKKKTPEFTINYGLNPNQSFIEDSIKSVGRSIERALETYADRQDKISKEEIEARDRVNISLRQYEAMQAHIKEITNKLAIYETVFKDIDLPDLIFIEPGSVQYVRQVNPFSMHDLHQISFKVKKEVSNQYERN